MNAHVTLRKCKDIRSISRFLDMDSESEHIFPNVDKCVMAAALKRERPFSCPPVRKIPMKPAHLVRAAAAVLPAAGPSISRTAWGVAADVGLRPIRRLGPVQDELSALEIAAMLICRLAGDHKPDQVAYAGRLGSLRCVKPYVITDSSSPWATVWGTPDDWCQTVALEAGHTFLNLLESLVIDTLAGRMDEGAHWLRYQELRFHRPTLMAELRLADAGRDLLDDGGRLSAALAPYCGLKATYRVEPPRLPTSLPEALAAAERSVPIPSRITVTRSLDLGAIVDLLEEMQ